MKKTLDLKEKLKSALYITHSSSFLSPVKESDAHSLTIGLLFSVFFFRDAARRGFD